MVRERAEVSNSELGEKVLEAGQGGMRGGGSCFKKLLIFLIDFQAVRV